MMMLISTRNREAMIRSSSRTESGSIESLTRILITIHLYCNSDDSAQVHYLCPFTVRSEASRAM